MHVKRPELSPVLLLVAGIALSLPVQAQPSNSTEAVDVIESPAPSAPNGTDDSAQSPEADASDDSALLEEIVVTARRSRETLQNVPLAIDAIGERTIVERGIQNVDDVADVSPALVFDEGLVPTDTRPVIRSLSSNRGRANVATLVDNIDVSGESMTTGGGGLTANMRLLDLERVEVVKGPQSVMYGRSAFSGAIYYVSKRPSELLEGQVGSGLDDQGGWESRLSVSGPLSRQLRGRFNAATWDADGQYRNPNTGEQLGGGDSRGAALALEWDGFERLTAYGRVEYSEEHYRPRGVVMRRSLLNSPPGNRDMFGISHGVVAPGVDHRPWVFDGGNVALCADPANREYPFFDNEQRGFCRPVLVGEQDARESEIDLSRDARDGGLFDGTQVRNLRAHLELNWAWDTVELQSLTGVTRNRSRTQEDFDLTSYVLGDPEDPTVLQYGLEALSDISHAVGQLSQELRVQRDGDQWDWFVSALYWQESHDTDWNDLFWLREGGFDVFALFGLQTATAPDTSTPTTVLRRDVSHHSLAASLSWEPVTDLRLTVEGRYLTETIDYFGTGEDRGAVSALGTCDFMGTPRESCPPGSNSVDASAFVPRLSVDWRSSPNWFSYVSYAEGFKPGGIDTLSANANVTDGEYRPEKLRAIEIGVKTNWIGRRLQLNAAVFQYRYEDQQQSVQVLSNNTLNTIVVNAGRTDVDGLELDLQWQIARAWRTGLGVVLTDARYADFNLARIAEQAGSQFLSANELADAGNAEGDFSGKQVRNTPKLSASWNLRYEMPLAGGDLYADLSGRYTDRRYLTHGNTSWLRSHSVWDLSLGHDRNHWLLQMHVSNLLDDDTVRSGLINPDYGFDATAQGGISNGALLILPPRRTVGVRLAYRF